MILFNVNKILVNIVISLELSFGAIFIATQTLVWICTEIINVIIHKLDGLWHMMVLMLINFKLESKDN